MHRIGLRLVYIYIYIYLNQFNYSIIYYIKSCDFREFIHGSIVSVSNYVDRGSNPTPPSKEMT
jgi:hypothetical protein